MQPTLKRLKTLKFSLYNEVWLNFHDIFETIFAIQASQVCVVVGKLVVTLFVDPLDWNYLPYICKYIHSCRLTPHIRNRLFFSRS